MSNDNPGTYDTVRTLAYYGSHFDEARVSMEQGGSPNVLRLSLRFQIYALVLLPLPRSSPGNSSLHMGDIECMQLADRLLKVARVVLRPQHKRFRPPATNL